jgi:ATP-binding cassette, subfamily B, bacterial MsbA
MINLKPVRMLFENSWLKLIIIYVEKCRIRYLAVIGLMMLASILEGGSIGSLAILASLVIDDGALLDTENLSFLKRFFEDVLSGISRDKLFILLTLLLVLGQLLKSVTTYIATRWMIVIKHDVQFQIESDFIDRIQEMPYRQVMQYPPGKFQAYLGMASTGAHLVRKFSTCVLDGMMFFIYVILMLAISTVLTVAALGLLLVLAFFFSFVVKKIRYYSTQLVEKDIDQHELYMKMLMKPRLLRLINGTHEVCKLLSERRSKVRTVRQKREIIESTVAPALDFIILFIATAGMIVLFSMDVEFDKERLTLGIMFLFILNRLLPRARGLNNFRLALGGLLPPLREITEFMEIKLIKGGASYVPYPRCLASEDLVFRGVTFSYDSQERKENTIEDVSFQLRWGEISVLMGESGSGKSTLIDLSAGLIEPDFGSIEVGPRKLNELDKVAWRNEVGVVDQKSGLLDNTILENLVFPLSDLDHDLVIEACKKAKIHDFILTLDDGYDSWIGDDGYGLSAGQAQRLMLARALIRNPTLLILDEATNSLDAESESYIIDSLRSLRGSTTILFATHQLRILEIADQILFLEKGKLQACKTKEELIERSSKFATMWGGQINRDNQH